jgi:hypothetical protein
VHFSWGEKGGDGKESRKKTPRDAYSPRLACIKSSKSQRDRRKSERKKEKRKKERSLRRETERNKTKQK